jgi:hypothetical protein
VPRLRSSVVAVAMDSIDVGSLAISMALIPRTSTHLHSSVALDKENIPLEYVRTNPKACPSRQQVTAFRGKGRFLSLRPRNALEQSALPRDRMLGNEFDDGVNGMRCSSDQKQKQN